MSGKLIVIEGGDGAGKATQTKLLVDRLRADGRTVETMSFPQYRANHTGALLKECLDGERGDFLAVDPKIVSTLYATDRFESRDSISDWLSAGSIVVLDRYTTANIIHQSTKLEVGEARRELAAWIHKLEHKVFGLPQPDVVCYLSVPATARARLVAARGAGAVDTAEGNQLHQASLEENVTLLGELYNVVHMIECMNGDVLCPPEEVHEAVYDRVRAIL